MFNIVPSLLVIIGLTGLVVIFNKGSVQKNCNSGDKLFSFLRIKKEHYWREKFLTFIERVLVHFRIIVLRLDQLLSRQTKRLRRAIINQEGKKESSSIFNSSRIQVEKSKQKEIPSISELDFAKEERKFLSRLRKFPQDEESLLNLARIYIWRKDFSSARAILLQVYRENKNNKILYSLLMEIKERDDHLKNEKSGQQRD